ncbi:hypothetical protein F4818DRAFT_416868 [Hypoxylon cercidicola]|nr:hypothetical protein F4818DRAFT_416868 [Hypoxylon cercidicola]
MQAPTEVPGWEMRAALSADEKKRRNAVIDAIVKKADGTVSYKLLKDAFANCETRLAEWLAKKGVLPTISANYFSWEVEKSMWEINLNKKPNGPKFPFEPPKMYGVPYSGIYLSCLGARQDMSLLEAKAFGPPAGAQYQLPTGVKRNQKYLAKLWGVMFPGRPYEEGCDEPFVVRFPCVDEHVFFSQCVARDLEETSAVMQEAALMLGKEFVLIAVMNASNQPFICLDFDESVDLEKVEAAEDWSIQSRFQRAWFDLLGVYLEWVRGRNVLLIHALRDMHKNRVVANFRHMAAEVSDAQKARRERAKDRARMSHEILPDAPEKTKVLLKIQVHRVREAAAKEAAAFVIPDKDDDDVDYLKAQVWLSDFVQDERWGCLMKYELMKLVEGAATKLVRVRFEQLLDRANQSADLFERLLDSFMTKELIWNGIMPPFDRLRVCEECLVGWKAMRPRVDAWISKIRRHILVSTSDDGLEVPGSLRQ